MHLSRLNTPAVTISPPLPCPSRPLRPAMPDVYSGWTIVSPTTALVLTPLLREPCTYRQTIPEIERWQNSTNCPPKYNSIRPFRPGDVSALHALLDRFLTELGVHQYVFPEIIHRPVVSPLRTCLTSSPGLALIYASGLLNLIFNFLPYRITPLSLSPAFSPPSRSLTSPTYGGLKAPTRPNPRARRTRHYLRSQTRRRPTPITRKRL